MNLKIFPTDKWYPSSYKNIIMDWRPSPSPPHSTLLSLHSIHLCRSRSLPSAVCLFCSSEICPTQLCTSSTISTYGLSGCNCFLSTFWCDMECQMSFGSRLCLIARREKMDILRLGSFRGDFLFYSPREIHLTICLSFLGSVFIWTFGRKYKEVWVLIHLSWARSCKWYWGQILYLVSTFQLAQVRRG